MSPDAHTPPVDQRVLPADATVDRSLKASLLGVASAALLLSSWTALLAWSLGSSAWPAGWLAVLVVALQTFLSTGLFITAHDAMHGSVAPRWPRLNSALGRTALALYALFPWRPMLEAHRRHHGWPGQARDPDAAPRPGASVVAWYLHFIRGYLRWPQVVGMAVIFNVLEHGVGIPASRLLVFWVLPLVLSTWQLFVFGTWLPHREEEHAPFPDAHRARSSGWPTWLSFLTCYHFGYHQTHHRAPGVPWWRLPRAERRWTNEDASATLDG